MHERACGPKFKDASPFKMCKIILFSPNDKIKIKIDLSKNEIQSKTEQYCEIISWNIRLINVFDLMDE